MKKALLLYWKMMHAWFFWQELSNMEGSHWLDMEAGIRKCWKFEFFIFSLNFVGNIKKVIKEQMEVNGSAAYFKFLRFFIVAVAFLTKFIKSSKSRWAAVLNFLRNRNSNIFVLIHRTELWEKWNYTVNFLESRMIKIKLVSILLIGHGDIGISMQQFQLEVLIFFFFLI